MKKRSDPPNITQEDMARAQRATRQIESYANFLRWAASFPRDELARHPSDDGVLLLSPLQSGRFCFVVEQQTVYLGVQDYAAAWMADMPFDRAYISDRLFLSAEGVACLDAKLAPLAIGIFVDDRRKRASIAAAQFVQPVRVTCVDGRITEVGSAFGVRIPLQKGDIVSRTRLASTSRGQQMDMSRFF